MKNILIVLYSIFLFSCSGNNGNSSETSVNAEVDGEQLFKINCAQCHRPSEDFVGPALKNAGQRWKDRNLLYQFVRNSQSVIQRDEYAKALFEKYNQSPMLPLPNLTDKDIDAILTYCNNVP